MKKLIAASIIISSLFIFGLLTSLLFADYNTVYRNFLANSAIKFAPKESNHFQVNKFPIPILKIANMKSEDGIALEDIEVKFSFWSLLTFRPKIESVRIAKITIQLDSNELSLVSHDKLIKGFISNKIGDSLNVSVNIANFIFLDNNNKQLLALKNVALIKNADNQTSFEGNFNEIGKFFSKFNEIDKIINFEFNISNQNYDFQLTEIYKDFKLVSGKGVLQLKDLPNIIEDILPDINFLASNISSKEVIAIKFDILPTAELLQLKNLVVSSKSVTGSGEINITKLNDSINMVMLNFTKIDLNDLFTLESARQVKEEYKTTEARYIFADKSMKADIAVNQVLLSNNEELKGVKFSADLQHGRFYVKDFSGQIQSGGEFKLAGEITQNPFRSVFDGKLYLKHNNLNDILSSLGYEDITVKRVTPIALSADLKCTLIDLYLQNILLRTDNVQMNGNFATKFIGAMPRISSTLNFSSMDLSKADYPVISPVLRFARSLTEKMQDQDYLSKFIPIRTLSYTGNFNITFNDLLFGESSFGKVSVFMNIEPNQIKVDDLYISSGSDYLISSLKLNAESLKPKLELKINDGSIHTKFLNPKSLLQLRNTMLKDFSMDKILLSVDSFLSKIYQNDLLLENVKLTAENDNILFKISNLEASTLAGKLKAQGSILLAPYTLNFVYALNSIYLDNLAKILPKGLINNQGAVSINGMFTTNGDTLEKLFYNLYSDSAIIAKDVRINNFSIDDLIGAVNSKSYDINNLQADLKNSLLTGQTAVSNLTANLSLNKGEVTLKNIVFKTEKTFCSASALFNIYNFGLNLSSNFSFHVGDRDPKKNYKDDKIINLGLKVAGTIFDPQKTADSAELLKFLQTQTTNNPKN